jgi:dienelactone hydrolase
MNGVNVYAANPTRHDRAGRQSRSKGQKAILVFPDIFGIDLINVQLITDKLATDLNTPAYLVDTFSGDDVPDGPQPNQLPVGFNITEWEKKHGPEQVLPLIENVIKNLTAQGVKRFAATGYCFGKYLLPCCFKSHCKSDRDCVSVDQD